MEFCDSSQKTFYDFRTFCINFYRSSRNSECSNRFYKISSLSDVEAKAEEGSNTILNIAKYVLGAVLGVALIFVIYALATNQPHAKEYLLGWIIAVAVIMVAFLII